MLFACTMNLYAADGRNLRHLVGRRIYVEFAGVRRRRRDAFAQSAMDEIGIDITQHTPRTLRDLHDTSFDLIITLSPEAHHQALELTRTMAVEVEYWPTFDATMMVGQGSREQIMHAYRSVRDQLSSASQRFGLMGPRWSENQQLVFANVATPRAGLVKLGSIPKSVLPAEQVIV